MYPGCFRLTDETIEAIIEHCPNLNWLDLMDCQITAKAVEQLKQTVESRAGVLELWDINGERQELSIAAI